MDRIISLFPRRSPDPLPSASELSTQSFDRSIMIIQNGIDHRQTIRWLRRKLRSLPSKILLLGVCPTGSQESALQEQLEALETGLKNDGREITTRIATGPRWISKVEQNFQDGDLLILFESGTATSETRLNSQELENRLAAPVWVISTEHYHWLRYSKFWSKVTMWLGALGIVFGSLEIQLKLMQTPNNWTQTILLCVSVITEFFLISRWNNLFSTTSPV